MLDLLQVHLKGSRFTLVREHDLVGDAGSLLVSVPSGQRFDDTTTYLNGAIVVGDCVRCGSATGRMNQWQDYWQTTPVVKILSYDKELNCVKFLTKSGSVYTVVGME